MGFSDSINAGVNMRNSRQQIAMEQQRNNLALAQFSEQQQERIKKESDAAKSADYFFKANPEGLTALGETPESFKNKSAGERFSAMVAYGQAMVERERQAKQQAQARDAGALGQFNQRVRNVTTPMQIPAGTFGYGVQGGRLAPSGAETVGGQPLNRSTAVELALRSGVNPSALRDIAGSFPQDDPQSQYKNETERMRAEAYRKQVENSAAGADVPDEQPEQQPPAGYTWVRTERGWAMKKSGMSGFPADSKPVNLNGVEYMQGPDGTLYPTKQPGSGAAIANALGEKGGGAAKVRKFNPATGRIE